MIPNYMLYNGNRELGLAEIAAINAALLTTCDGVFINANCSIKPGDVSTYEHIYFLLNKYHDEGLVYYWDYPNTGLQTDYVLPEADYLNWAKMIDSASSGETSFSLLQYLDGFGERGLQERSSMLVDVKREYWHYAISNMLPTTQFLHAPLSRTVEQTAFPTAQAYRYGVHQQPLAERLFTMSEIDTEGLALLSFGQMKRLRKASTEFRALIEQWTSSLPSDPDETAEHALVAVSADLFKEYRALTPTVPRRALSHLLSVTGFLALPVGLQLLLASIGVAEDALPAISAPTRPNKGMFYFLARVSRATQQSKKNHSERRYIPWEQ